MAERRTWLLPAFWRVALAGVTVTLVNMRLLPPQESEKSKVQAARIARMQLIVLVISYSREPAKQPKSTIG
jgi:predicted MFS family arabinose efflux permease